MLMNTGSKSLQTTLDVIRSSLGVYIILPASLYFGSVSLVYGQEESGVNRIVDIRPTSPASADFVEMLGDDSVQGSGAIFPLVRQSISPAKSIPSVRGKDSPQAHNGIGAEEYCFIVIQWTNLALMIGTAIWHTGLLWEMKRVAAKKTAEWNRLIGRK